jgi:hypothetical protein
MKNVMRRFGPSACRKAAASAMSGFVAEILGLFERGDVSAASLASAIGGGALTFADASASILATGSHTMQQGSAALGGLFAVCALCKLGNAWRRGTLSTRQMVTDVTASALAIAAAIPGPQQVFCALGLMSVDVVCTAWGALVGNNNDFGRATTAGDVGRKAVFTIGAAATTWGTTIVAGAAGMAAFPALLVGGVVGGVAVYLVGGYWNAWNTYSEYGFSWYSESSTKRTFIKFVIDNATSSRPSQRRAEQVHRLCSVPRMEQG